MLTKEEARAKMKELLDSMYPEEAEEVATEVAEETAEETADVAEEPVSIWDREVADDDYADKQSKGFHNIIKAAHKAGLKTGTMKAPGADIHADPAGIYYDENNNNMTDQKKLKLISKWKWIESGFQPNSGGHLEDDVELPKFEEYREKYNAWKAEHPNDPHEEMFDDKMDIDYDFDDVAEESEESLEESIKSGEARLNEAFKSDYDKLLEEIADFSNEEQIEVVGLFKH